MSDFSAVDNPVWNLDDPFAYKGDRETGLPCFLYPKHPTLTLHRLSLLPPHPRIFRQARGLVAGGGLAVVI